jgi:hypothetical protein
MAKNRVLVIAFFLSCLSPCVGYAQNGVIQLGPGGGRPAPPSLPSANNRAPDNCETGIATDKSLACGKSRMTVDVPSRGVPCVRSKPNANPQLGKVPYDPTLGKLPNNC